jgi:hypothetical protein
MIYVDSISGSPYGTGGKVTGILFSGLGNTDSTNQHGVVVNANKRWLIERNTFVSLGGYATKLGDDYESVMTTFHDNSVRLCKGAVYGRSTSGKSVNAIDIDNNHIAYSKDHAIDVIGNKINITRNIIEFGDSAGVILDARDVGEITCSASSVSIDHNHFEDNAGGEIFMNYYYDGSSVFQYLYDIKIHDNRFACTFVTYDKPEADAMITVQRDPSSNANAIILGLEVYSNNYNESNGMPYFDGNNQLYYGSKIEVPAGATYGTEVVDCNPGQVNIGDQIVGHMRGSTVVAGTGITAAMHATSEIFYPVLGSSVDITTNPQIANGYRNGQMLIIINLNGSYTLTLDDGDGLQIGSQFVMGAYDVIVLMYYNSNWIQISRSDN